MGDIHHSNQAIVEASVRGFEATLPTSSPGTPARQAEAEEKLNLKLKDWRDRLKWRKIYFFSMLGLLIGQNVLMFALLFLSGWLKIDIKALSVFATATLAETYGLVQIILQHLVKDIEYEK